jgi:hypothetical protein
VKWKKFPTPSLLCDTIAHILAIDANQHLWDRQKMTNGSVMERRELLAHMLHLIGAASAGPGAS